MKTINILLFLLVFWLPALRAQTITYRIANKVITATEVEFDVTIESSTAFKLGSGQLYFNYNADAFGQSAVAAGRVTVTHPFGSTVLGQGWYGSFISNDNTASRFSFSWQQALSAGYFSENVYAAAAVLLHVKMDFQPGGNVQGDQICFEASGNFDDQTFTACGPHTPPPPFPQIALADCTNFPGTQLLDDNFDCSALALPVDLLSFQASPLNATDALLEWTTASELNSSHFNVERSLDGRSWQLAGTVAAAGISQTTLKYRLIDERVFDPAEQHEAVFYYRLKMNDLDCTYTYSDVRQVRYESKGGLFIGELFPNPASRSNVAFQLPVFTENGATLQLTVFDIKGSVVGFFETDLAAGSQLPGFELGQLAAGVYHLKVSAGGVNTTKRLVVQ